MGGKKKLSLKQIERMQTKKDDDKKKKKEKVSYRKDKKTLSILSPDPKNEKNVSEIKKMKVLTPYQVASKFNIRISTAKDFLEQLETNGSIQLVSKNRNLKIYKPVKA